MLEIEASAVGVAASPVFVGRSAQLRDVASFIDRAGAGRGAIVLVDGESGIGKTALIRQAADLACERGMRVMLGAGTELEQRLPFALIGSCLALTSAPVPGRRPEASGDEEAAGNRLPYAELAAVSAVVDLLRRWCAEGPVALLIDDIQWADAASLSVLRRLAAEAAELPIFVMATMRTSRLDEGVSTLLTELGGVGAHKLTLDRLPDSEVRALVESMSGQSVTPGLIDAAAGAAGNPGYVTALVTGVLRSDTPIADGAPLPPEVLELIMRRLDYLPHGIRRVLEVAAVLTPQVDAVELAEVLDTPVLEVWNAVRGAVEVGLLEHDTGELVFRHDLIRRVLAAHVPPSLRMGLQRRAAAVLVSMNAPADRIAMYLLADPAPPSESLVEWLVTMAPTLMARDSRLASEALVRALSRPNLASPTRDALRGCLIRALLLDGLYPEAESEARSALAQSPKPANAHELHWLLVQVCFRQGRLVDAVAEGRIALSQPDLTRTDEGRLRGLCALASYFLARDEARGEAELAIEISAEQGDSLGDYYALQVFGSLHYSAGRLDQALEISDRLVESYERVPAGTQRWDRFDPYLFRACCLIELDRFAEADRVFAAALVRDQPQSGLLMPISELAHRRLLFLTGRWDEPLEGPQDRPTGPDPYGIAPAARGMAALIAVHRGTFHEGMLTGVTADRHHLGARGYMQFVWWAAALAHESMGRPDRALAEMIDLLELLDGGGTRPMATVYDIYPDISRLATITGDQDVVARVAVAAERLAAVHATSSRRATALLCRGVADQRIELVGQAADAYNQAGRPLCVAQTYETLAVMFAVDDQLSSARAALETAVDGYSALGARWDIARAEARLRLFRVRRGTRGSRKRPKSGWEALTVTEQKVAVLVAKGGSNADIAAQMFLSPRTIQTHVSNILAKLGLQSRVQVAVAYAGRS
ncbi:helix-turn-helix transcriptional regulator [Nocardia alni]|uniref:helix-turn-helix transcriptional regulator n=1 Tax=Nocardia alni TaxID=2815723 RepID=UPI001C229901|nr:AAA family ATPase [Nocardia alni]